MEENIILYGRVPWEEIPNYYQLANIFVTASKSETQGLTVIEAMAAGLTPVAIDDEAFNTVIKDGENGRLFRTKKELREIVEECRKNPIKLEKLSQHARLSSENYSSKYYAKSILQVYEDAIKNYPGAVPVIKKLVNKVKREKDEVEK